MSSTRLVFEVEWTEDGDVSASMATLAEIIAEQDGVAQVLGYGPLTKVIAPPAFDHYEVEDGDGRWVRGTP
jgi:hypothetical protein